MSLGLGYENGVLDGSKTKGMYYNRPFQLSTSDTSASRAVLLCDDHVAQPPLPRHFVSL